jgi:nicotinamide riboside transporter PnuC
MLWFANAIILLGVWLLGYKYRHAFLLSIAGEVVYVFVAYHREEYEICILSAVFCVLAGRNWWKWGSK